MQKTKYFSRFYHSIFTVFIPVTFFCSELSSTHYFIMKINKNRELQNIAINHAADIDYKEFINIYREFTKEPYNFLTIDTTLPENNF